MVQQPQYLCPNCGMFGCIHNPQIELMNTRCRSCFYVGNASEFGVIRIRVKGWDGKEWIYPEKWLEDNGERIAASLAGIYKDTVQWERVYV